MCAMKAAQRGKAETKSTKVKDQMKTRRKIPKKQNKNKRKAVNCSYIQPAVSRESSNADKMQMRSSTRLSQKD